MRYIRTTNNEIEFIESNASGVVLTSIGLQLGEVYFQIKGNKVAFYLNDSEKPFDNFIWSMNLPMTIDDETYETEEEASAALKKIMVLDDLSQIREDLDNEIARSMSEDAKHNVQISGLTEDLDDLTDKVEAEILRSVSKDQEHDDAISGLTDSIEVERQNRIAGDTQLMNVIGIESDDRRHADVLLKDLIDSVDADLNAEIQNRASAYTELHDEILSERERALLAESGLSEILTNEIIRSTNKDSEHDNHISGLTDDIAELDEIKQDKLIAGKYITINGNNISADSNHVYRLTQAAYNALPEIDVEGLYIITDAPDIDLSIYATVSALTQEVQRATSAENEIRESLTEYAPMSALTAEIARAEAADADIIEDLEDEFHRAQSAEHLLEDKITTERERALDAEAELAEQISAMTGITSAVTDVQITNSNEEIKMNISKAGGNTQQRILKAGYGIKIDADGTISLDVTISGNTLIIN